MSNFIFPCVAIMLFLKIYLEIKKSYKKTKALGLKITFKYPNRNIEISAYPHWNHYFAWIDRVELQYGELFINSPDGCTIDKYDTNIHVHVDKPFSEMLKFYYQDRAYYLYVYFTPKD